MRFLRRIAGIFGLLKDEPNEEQQEEDHHNHQQQQQQRQHQHQHHNHNHHQHHHRGDDEEESRRATRGFSVQLPVAPVLTPTHLGDGGVQGLRWYAKRLRIDEDGDVADEFLDEVLPEVVEMPSNVDDKRPLPKFEVKYRTRPAKVRKQIISNDGKVQQSVEFHGRLQLV